MTVYQASFSGRFFYWVKGSERRQIMKPVLLIAWTAFLSIIIAPAQAQTRAFPTHPVRIIVATSAGSGADPYVECDRLIGSHVMRTVT